MMPRVFCGTFEAEAYWREPDLARLPSLVDRSASRVVEAMDEMLFAFCDAGDCLLTVKRLDDAHTEYLHDIGFTFHPNQFDLVWNTDEEVRQAGAPSPPSIFQRMGDERFSQRLAAFLPHGARLEPFAVLPGASEVAQRFGLAAAFPPQEVIRRVNTKVYALELRERLEIPNPGVIVEDIGSLSEAGSILLCRGPFLVKDDYGVSGKGNQLIETERAMQRILRYVSGQISNGKRLRFVLEPYLEKHSDFSCQFQIDEGGGITVISVQELLNNGLAFGASCSASPELLEILDRAGYFNLIERMGSLMHGDGYHGDVCVDSMILRDGQLAPLVEINARKSMSLIKHAVDRHLATREVEGRLTYVSTLSHRPFTFAAVLELLDREGLLFTADRTSGVLPLTSRTMSAGQAMTPGKGTKGKLYMATVFETPEEHRTVIEALERTLQKGGVRVMH